MTDTRNVVAHFVTDEAVAAGRHAGRYAGVCGAVVVPGSLLEDTGRGCRFCHDWVRYTELNANGVREAHGGGR